MIHTRGFTLIELLIVVAIIAILVAIAIPNFLEAQVRAKISRSKADLRTIGMALEEYAVDFDTYPQSNIYAVALTPEHHPGLPPTLERLSTPIAYMKDSAVHDPFEVMIRYSGLNWENETPITEDEIVAARVYHYTARNEDGMSQHGDSEFPRWWILEGVGPDRHHHNLSGHINYIANDAAGYDSCLHAVYDSTNGTVSRGSIWRAGGSPVGQGAVFYKVTRLSQR